MSGSQFGINYIINVTTSNIEAVDGLYRSLVRVQELARQGADFSVRIEKNGLDGIKESVAKAVSEGVAAAGGRMATPRYTRTEDAAGDPVRREKLDQLLRNMGQLTTAINTLATKVGSGGGTVPVTRMPGDTVRDFVGQTRALDDVGFNSEIAAGTHEIHQTKRRLAQLRGRLKGAESMLSQRVIDADQDANNFEALLKEARDGIRILPPTVRNKYKKYIQDLRRLYGEGNVSGEDEMAVLQKDMRELLGTIDKLKRRAAQEVGDLRRKVELEERHLSQLTTTQAGRYDERRSERGFRNERTGFMSGGYGNGAVALTFDKAAIEAAFESAAVRFAERTMQIWNGEFGVGLHGIGGARPATGPGSYGTSGGGTQDGPIPCTRCGGSGVYHSAKLKSLCMRCGGSGIENMPNMAVIQRISGQARQFGPGSQTGTMPSQHIQGMTPQAAQYAGVTGEVGPVVFAQSTGNELLNTAGNTPPGYRFIPHSVGRRAKILEQINEMVKVAGSRSAYVYKLDEKTGLPMRDEGGRVQYESVIPRETQTQIEALRKAGRFAEADALLSQVPRTGQPTRDAQGRLTYVQGLGGKNLQMSNLNMNERPLFYETLNALTAELERGGILHPEGNAHRFEREGMIITSREMRAMQKGFQPSMAGSGAMFNTGDPLQQATIHANELTAAFGHLNKVDLSHVSEAFKLMSSELASLKGDLQAIAPLMNTVTASEMRVRSEERLNVIRKENRRERDLERQNRIKDRDDLRAMNEARVRRELLEHDAVMSGADPMMGSQPQRLFKALGLSLRGFNSNLEAAAVARENALLFDERGSGKRAAGERLTAANALTRADVLSARAIGRAERLGAMDRRFRDVMPDIQNYRDAETRFRAGSLIQRRLEELSNKDLEVQKNDKLSRDQQRIQLAMNEAQRLQYLQDFGGLHGTGMGPHPQMTPAMVRELNDQQSRALREQQGLLTQTVAKKYESVKLAEKETGLLDQFLGKFKSLGMYLVAGGVMYTAMNVIRSGIMDAARFEQEMAEVQGIFVGKSPTDRMAVQSGVMSLAYQYGVDRADVARQAKLFAQTGASPGNTINMTRDALLATKGAGLDPAQATEMMIAVQNLTGGKTSAADIIDRISRIEARYPVTAQDLSLGIQRVGSIATEFQPQLGSVDQFDAINGMMTSMISKTRVSGNQAATALRFMIARLNAPEVQRKLQQQFGIKLGGDNPYELRPLTDVLGDIAGKYNGYLQNGESGKAAGLLTTFAGARQANMAAALFDNWKGTMDVARESSLAFGDAQKRLAIQMDTLVSRVERTHNAFSNLVTVLLEKTGMLELMKLGVSGAGYVMNGAANHPMLSTGLTSSLMLLGGRLLGGVASGAGPGLVGGAAGIGGSLLTGGAIAGAGLLAYQATSALDIGGYRAANARNDRYGPLKYDRGVYRESEQGKAFAEQAKSFGLSDDQFYQRIGKAVADAQAKLQTDPRFAGKGDLFSAYGNARTNPKLFNAMNQELVSQLGGQLIGFDTTTPDAKTKATQMIRAAMLYGNAAYSVQAAGFLEHASTGEQDLATAFNTPHGMATLPADIQRSLRMGYRMRMDSKTHDVGYDTYTVGIRPLDIGFDYSAKMAEQLHHTSASSQFKDVAEILNSFDGEQHVGDVMAGLRIGGKSVLRMAIDKLASSTMNLGQVLDEFASTILKTDEGSGALRKAISQQLELTYQKAERDQAAAGASPGNQTQVGNFTGGVFAKRYLEEYHNAVQSMVKSGKFDSTNKAFQNMLAFDRGLQNPGNRETTELAIAASMNGINVRAILQDRLMNPIFQYGQRMGSINSQQRLFGKAGLSFDTIGARAEAARSFLTGIAETEGGIPIDAMKASQEYKLALSQAKGFGIDMTDLFSGEEMAPGKNMVDPKVLAAMRKAVKSGGTGFSPEQTAQLAVKAKVMRQSLQDFVNSTDGVFDMLDDDQKKLLAGLLSIKDPVQAFLAALSQKDQLEKIGLRQTPYIDEDLTRHLNNVAFMGESNRALSRISHVGDMAQLASGFGARLASAQSNPFLALQYMQAGISSKQDTALQLAQQEYNTREAAARREFGPGTDKYKSAIADAAESLQTAVLKANQDAQTGMVSLLNDTRLKYVEMQEQHLNSLVQQSTEGFKQLLSDPSRFAYRWYDAIVGPLAKTLQGGVADSFINNLIGPDGLFADQAKSLFNNGLFQQASIIKMAHIQGITEGMRAAYGMPGTPMSLPDLPGVGPGAGFDPFGGGGIGNPFGLQLPGGSSLGASDIEAASRVQMKAAVKQQALMLAGSIAGTQLGAATGVRNGAGQPNNYGSEGATFGGLLGNLLPIPGGSIVGSLIGGFLGGRLGKERHDQTTAFEALQKIERNTRETVTVIQNQTAVLSLNNRLLNAPSTFHVPSYSIQGGGGGGAASNQINYHGDITINVDGSKSPTETAKAVMSSLKEDRRTRGTFVSKIGSRT